jgi:hypothetical protein
MATNKETKYKFTGRLEALGAVSTNFGIIIPEEILASLPEAKRYRVKGFINKTPFSLAINSLKIGFKYFAVGAPLRKACKIRQGEEVEVTFHIVDPNMVDLPEELIEVLAQDEEGNKIWQSFKPGMQRSLAYYVNSVKNTDSRIKRALELIHKAKTRTLFSQKNNY